MIDLLARTTVILGVTWVLCRLLPRATAATRHLLWHLAVVVVLVAPVVAKIAPTFETTVLPTQAATPSAFVSATEIAPALPRTDGARLNLVALWAAGSTCVGLWILVSHLLCARRIKRLPLAPAALQRTVAALATRPVQVVIAANDEGPFVRGLFRPSIVLPVSAETWTEDRRRAVLLHELAHVRRGDCRVQLLANVACAVYWFNPLVWIAARALRIERERACDDEVIVRGATPSAYAADLLDLARARQMRASSAVLAMARPSELEGRLLAILASHRPRVPARVTRFSVALTICALAMVTLGARPAHPRDTGASNAAEREWSQVNEPHQDREQATLRLALDSRPDVVAPLIAALQDQDAQVREKAALGLGWRRDDRVIAPLITALGDDDSQVREKAAIALGSSGHPDAIGPLEAALRNDPNGEVREKAAVGLTLLRAGGDPEANGKQVRDALNQIVGGLLRLTQ